MKAYMVTKHQVFPRVEAKDMDSAAVLAMSASLGQASTVNEGKLVITVEPYREPYDRVVPRDARRTVV